MYLAQYKIIPPKQWYHSPNLQDKIGMTVAMLLAWDKKEIPKQWICNPALQNNDGWTVAMYIAMFCRQVPDRQWQHDPNIKNKYGYTVEYCLKLYNIPVPDNWKRKSDQPSNINETNNYTPEQNKKYIEQYCNYYNIKLNYNIKAYYQNDTDGRTVAMFLANKGIVPPKCFEHDPNMQDIYGQTVAMRLAYNQKEIPEQWAHQSTIQDTDGWTATMYIAHFSKQIPSKEWQHDPNLKNKHGRTVQYFLQLNHINVPDNWKCE